MGNAVAALCADCREGPVSCFDDEDYPLSADQLVTVEGFSALDSSPSSAPAGKVFQESLQQLSPLDRQLLVFCSTSSLVLVRWLAHLGADWDACDDNATTCLHVACRAGSLAVVYEVLAHGGQVDVTDIAHWTPLHIAAHMGRREVVAGLLQARADPKALNGMGLTPAQLSMDRGTREALMSYRSQEELVVTSPRPPATAFLEDSIGVPQQCEPELFFISPNPAFPDTRLHRKTLLPLAVYIFNLSPSVGLAFAVASGVAESYTSAMRSIMRAEGVSEQQLGDFLGEAFSLSNLLRYSLLDAAPLLHTGVVSGLAAVFQTIRAPQDLQKLDRLVRGIALVWWRKHRMFMSSEAAKTSVVRKAETAELVGLELMQYLGSAEALGQIMLSALLLNTAILAGEKVVPLEKWVELNQGAEEGGTDIAEPVQRRIYETLTTRSVTLPVIVLHGDTPWPEEKEDGLLSPFARLQKSQVATWSRSLPFAQVQGSVTLVGYSLPSPDHGPAPNSEVLDAPLTDRSEASRRYSGTSAKRTPRPDAATKLLARLHNFVLLFFRAEQEAQPGAAEEAPVAMIDVRPLQILSSDTTWRRFTLARSSRGEGTAPAAAPAGVPKARGQEESGWPLKLILLLPDGQWQEVGLPSLNIEVQTSAELDAWLKYLGQVFEHAD